MPPAVFGKGLRRGVRRTGVFGEREVARREVVFLADEDVVRVRVVADADLPALAVAPCRVCDLAAMRPVVYE
jgi:hypothetical protein